MNVKGYLTVSALLFLFSGMGCGSDSTGPGGEDPPVSWTLGDQETYTVTGNEEQTVFDVITGLEFRFPNGGEGELTVAEIAESPVAPVEGFGFSVDFTGTSTIELVVDRFEDDEEIMVLAYGMTPACYDDETAANERWLAIPETEHTDIVSVFELDVATDELGNSLSKSAVRTFKYHWISRLNATSADYERRQAIRWQSQDFVAQFVGELSGATRTRVDGELKGRLAPRYEWDGLYYSGFWWRSLGGSRRLVKPAMHFIPTTSASSVAHETGHYLVHALVGDNVQSTLEGQANLYTPHEIGDNNHRAKLVDEYAYFLEYYFTNVVASYNPENPYSMWGGLAYTPLTRDLPGHEGFGLLMLSGLTRTGTSVQSLVSPRIMLPLPELKLPFDHCFDIIAKGATDIHGLLANIQSSLTPGENKQYQVIMQRSGWQYSIAGTLVDKDGKAVEDVLVSNFVSAGGTVYEGGLSSIPSDEDGNFSITGDVFPGTSMLRCIKGTDTTHVQLPVDWTNSTNATVKVGELTVDFDNILSRLQARSSVSITVEGEHFTNYGSMVGDERFSPDLSTLIWNGVSFAAIDTSSGTYYTSERRVTGTVSPKGKTIVRMTYTYRFRSSRPAPSPNHILSQEVDVEVTITDINYTGDYYDYLRFNLSGAETGSHVSLKYKRVVEWDSDEIGTTTTEYTHTNWGSTTVPPSVTVYF